VLVRAPLALRCGCRNVGGAAGPHCCESPPGVMARVPGTCTTELRVSRAMGWFSVCYQGSSFRRPCVVWFGPEQARYGKSTAVVAAPSSWYLTVFYVGDLSGGGRAGGCWGSESPVSLVGLGRALVASWRSVRLSIPWKLKPVSDSRISRVHLLMWCQNCWLESVFCLVRARGQTGRPPARKTGPPPGAAVSWGARGVAVPATSSWKDRRRRDWTIGGHGANTWWKLKPSRRKHRYENTKTVSGSTAASSTAETPCWITIFATQME